MSTTVDTVLQYFFGSRVDPGLTRFLFDGMPGDSSDSDDGDRDHMAPREVLARVESISGLQGDRVPQVQRAGSFLDMMQTSSFLEEEGPRVTVAVVGEESPPFSQLKRFCSDPPAELVQGGDGTLAATWRPAPAVCRTKWRGVTTVRVLLLVNREVVAASQPIDLRSRLRRFWQEHPLMDISALEKNASRAPTVVAQARLTLEFWPPGAVLPPELESKAPLPEDHIHRPEGDGCIFCDGYGRRDCDVCDGNGFTVCGACGGSAPRNCELCGGSGVLPGALESIGTGNFARASMTGRRCAVCWGSSRTCGQCFGMQRLRCSACSGSGWFACTRCNTIAVACSI